MRHSWSLAAGIMLGVCSPVVARAQDAPPALVGRVRDGTTGKPLAGAAVDIVGTVLGATTDSAGLFRVVHGALRGTTQFRARRIGYQGITDTVTLADRTTDLGTLILDRTPLLIWVDRFPVCTEIRNRPDSLAGGRRYSESTRELHWIREYRTRDGRDVLERCYVRIGPDSAQVVSR